MRRRLFLFHTLTLLAALAALLAVSGGVLHRVADDYRRQMDAAEAGRLDQAQILLESLPEQPQDWPELTRQLMELSRQLAGLDYSLVVEWDGQVVYSTLDQFQEDVYRRLSDKTALPQEGAMRMQSDGVLMVGRRWGSFLLLTMSPPQVPEILGRQRPQSEAAMLSLLVSGVAAIGVIVGLSLLFTRYQVRRIMRPVNALAQAARRVESGDLSTPVGYGGQDEFTAVCTAFDHMQQHLLEEREKNAKYEQARTDLVAGISHDLRTPLTSVKGYIKGMRDGVANTPEKREQYLSIAYRKACDMERLLQRLFYFSKIETGDLPLSRTHTDLGEFVAGFVREAGEELAQSGGQVVLRGAPAPHPVYMDQEQMYRVLTNLKENALRYAGADPLVLTLTVWRQRDRECLRFADNGRGVPEEQLPHLFERFWRGDEARGSRNGDASGLGLYIVKRIVEAHGGTVQARNNCGLVIEIALPCEEEEDEQNSDRGG